MNIKAIETSYSGYRFRSRLEARWAVFFDALGIEWEYEKEGYDLGENGWYLPDFWLPQVSSWAEVKPGPLAEIEFTKCYQLVILTESPCILLDVTRPKNRPYFEVLNYDWGKTCHELYKDFQRDIWGHSASVCLTMYHNYPISEGRFYAAPGGPDDGVFDDVEDAVHAALSARFEHGEKVAK